ncbi:hypothetical protein PR202_ga14937 [Eleusine coracana subsp. coracana]|uniref:VQ domain-containing protein n=1 Tax=Eleusine coracana subsp. coracana TaxID=191504 RepID=A0AAV5CI09_ELECO|nr:hypothetical protein QOZ80_6BG0498630 [Eleusine coracana subsp. coracana]GJM97968.1 hypothetical protein PR202_ga14937 [Eleusine coracana subsp. coracana]
MAEHHGLSTSTMPVQQHRGSYTTMTTTTTRPKIKIIHIVAPEIIKTDVANFRDLVQRLTGKPTTTGVSSMTNMPSPPPVEEDNKEIVVKKRPPPAAAAPVTIDDFLLQQEPTRKKRKIKCEVKVEEEGGFGDYGLDYNDLWMDLNPGAGSFLSFLEEELEVFQGLQAADHDFLQMPLGPARMDLVGEMYAS